MINLNTFLRQNLLLKGFPNKSKHIFGIHKNQVGLMKLKGFSPLGVTISIYEKVLPVVPNTIGFAKKQIHPLHHDHVAHFLKVINPETN